MSPSSPRGSWVAPGGILFVDMGAAMAPSPTDSWSSWKAEVQVAVWTAHRRDKRKETTQHCTEWIRQNTKELHLRAEKWTHLSRRGSFSGGEKPLEEKRRCGETEQAREGRFTCSFFLFFSFLAYNSALSLGKGEGRVFYLLPQWKTGAGRHPGWRALGEAWSSCLAWASELTAT